MKKIFLILFLLLVMFITGCNEPTPGPDPQPDPKEAPEVISFKEAMDNLDNKTYLELVELKKNYDSYSAEIKDAIGSIKKLERQLEKLLAERKDAVGELVTEYLENNLEDEVPYQNSSLDWKKQISIPFEGTNYNISLEYEFSDSSIIDKAFGVHHSPADQTIGVSIYYYNNELKLEDTFEKEIIVMGYTLKPIKNRAVASGYFYSNSRIEEIDIKTLDIINYSFGTITQSGDDYHISIDKPDFAKEVIALHEYGIRVTLALGGWHDDSAAWIPYQNMIKTPESRKKAISALMNIMKLYSFDGFDLDWEYPRGADRTNLGVFMNELKAEMIKYNPNAILSIAVGCGSSSANYYDYPNLIDCIDYFNLMCYDFDYDGRNKTVHLCNLSPGTYTSSSVEVGVGYLIGQRVPRNKIIIGAAFYARVFNGVDSTNNGLGQVYSSKTYMTFTNLYNNYLNNPNTTFKKYYDAQAKAYYLYDSASKTFISYEDPDSIRMKCEYLKEMGLAGLMFWCHSEDATKVLMQAMYDNLIK